MRTSREPAKNAALVYYPPYQPLTVADYIGMSTRPTAPTALLR
jgi:hypothetical protein